MLKELRVVELERGLSYWSVPVLSLDSPMVSQMMLAQATRRQYLESVAWMRGA